MNYSDSETLAIVAEYKQGIPVKGLSVKYEVSERTIYRWVKQYPIVARADAAREAGLKF